LRKSILKYFTMASFHILFNSLFISNQIILRYIPDLLTVPLK
jgi:hypothetical protein